MAPGKIRTFHYFRKLPTELRLKIWGMAADEPRIIHAQWRTETAEYNWEPHYCLNAGPVPSVLRANHESRREALKKYTLVKARLQIRHPVVGKVYRDNAIYINFNVDTIYALKVPELPGFLTWLRRLQLERNRGGETTSKVACLAFPDGLISSLAMRKKLQDLFYPLCMQSPIQKIILVLDSSKFHETKEPHRYSFHALSEASEKSMAIRHKIIHKEPSDYLGQRIFDESFVNMPTNHKFKYFKEKNPDWERPSLPMMTISKAKPKPASSTS